MSTKQLANELGEPPTRLYHHVSALESAGLIALVETRPNRGTVEKYYRAMARRYQVDRRLLAPHDDPEGVSRAAASLVSEALEETWNATPPRPSRRPNPIPIHPPRLPPSLPPRENPVA